VKLSLALATLLYEWPRYIAAVAVLAMSGMLILVMFGLFSGIIHSDLAITERSRADLFILPPKVNSIANSNPSLPARVQPVIYLNPHVVEVRSLEETFGQWVNQGAKQETKDKQEQQTFVSVWAVDTVPNSVTIPRDFTEETRTALMEPGAIAVDESTLPRLGVALNGSASINGHQVFVRSIIHGYPSIEQPTVVASRETVRLLSRRGNSGNTDTGPLLVRLDDPGSAESARDALNANAHGLYRAWTAKEFNKANEDAVLGQQIIGIILSVLVVISCIIGVVITAMTLRGAILSNIREFASLRALGISMGSLRLIVVELSAWTGVVGAFGATLFSLLTALLSTNFLGLPIILHPVSVVVVCVFLEIVAMISGALAMGILKRSEPADLLR
jgi:putative ABC transport system permease protein